MRSIKEECLDQLIFFSERSLRHAITGYVDHYHEGRPHQGVGNRPIEPRPEESWPIVTPECRKQLGGSLRSYERRAA
ncbi:MAG: integrase core domain-containing protein [Planctomycetota bacterium]